MRQFTLYFVIACLIGVLVACNNGNQEDEATDTEEELPMLEVDFIIPETAEAGETVLLKADVTYDGEAVTDADEVIFELWEVGKKEDSEKIDGENHGDGSYTINYTFEHDGVYEMYAHTTAQGQHTMPKKQITIGEGATEEHHHEDEAHFHTEGFDLHFMEPEQVTSGESIPLVTHITLHEEPLENAQVRYEIWPDGNEDLTEWVDASEDPSGEYSGEFTFAETGIYHIQIHIQDDNDLHEHVVYEIEAQ